MATNRTGDPMTPANNEESALYGLKLYVDRYGNAVSNLLQQAGISVIQSPACFKILHTSFPGSFKELTQKIPELTLYPVKQYRWWHRITEN
ncbi:hypothetical protein GF312_13875 [Candidatus Poribacteria bacterium]|nr:hypothetical protein [Candidatus Poribacteria bacterium]